MAQGPSDSLENWRGKARRFAAQAVHPRLDEMYREGRIHPEIISALARDGFMGLGLPAEWGGQGGGTREVAAVLEELAAESASVATLLSVHLSVCAQPIAQWGTEPQRTEFLADLCAGRTLGAFGLTEPGVGSDTARLTCRYRRDGDSWILQGSKMFITNGSLADTLVVFASRDPSEGSRGISAFIVTKGTPGFSAPQKLEKLGLRDSETTELLFMDAHLGRDRLLGPEGKGLSVALGALAGGRIGIAAVALGVARAAFEETQRIAQAEPTDARRTAVAQSFTDVLAARALIERAAEVKDAGLPFAEDASAAKLFASQAAFRVASRCVDVAGMSGSLDGGRPGRLWRDARVFPIVEGTTEIQELILGRTLVGQ